MVAALSCAWPQFQWYQLAYATEEIESIQLHDSLERLSQKIVSITLHIPKRKKTNCQRRVQVGKHHQNWLNKWEAALNWLPLNQ